MIVKKIIETESTFIKEKDGILVPLTGDLHSTFFFDKRFDPDDGVDYIIKKFGIFTYSLIFNFIKESINYANSKIPCERNKYYFSANLPIFTENERVFDSDFYMIKCNLEVILRSTVLDIGEGEFNLRIEFYEEEKVYEDKEEKE